MNPRWQPTFILIAIFFLISLTACGGGSGVPVVPPAPKPVPAPVFGSAPVTVAVEGTAYTYQLAASDPAGGSVAFKLTSAPAGATLNGNTVTWIPTAEQSRVANQFSATATTSGGGSATQSWTVTPNGTVRISWVDTIWNENGSTNLTLDWTSVSSYVSALVPQPDGTFQTLHGSAAADGRFEIPNVPAGYYWLRIAPRGTYWTSSSTFDMGGDHVAPLLHTVGSSLTTTFNFNFSGLEPMQGQGTLNVAGPVLNVSAATLPGSSTFSSSMQVSSNIDFSQNKTAYVLQYKPTTFGTVAGSLLGPSLTLTDLSWTTGGINNVTGTLIPSPIAAANVSIKGSAWAPLFGHAAPLPPTPLGTPFSLAVQPFVSGRVAESQMNMALFTPAVTGSFTNVLNIGRRSDTGCSGYFSSSSSFPRPLPPLLLTDQDFGTVQYGDPFPAEWLRVFSLCQQASVDVPAPGSTDVSTFTLTNGQLTAPPTAPVAPLISPVENPTMNGASFFTANTINTTNVTLSWSKPAIGNPYGYEVQVATPTTLPNGTQTYSSVATLGTAKTTMTLPPDILVPGKTYLFVITALADGRANMETSPHRSALPMANADALSAPLTISSAPAQ